MPIAPLAAWWCDLASGRVGAGSFGAVIGWNTGRIDKEREGHRKKTGSVPNRYVYILQTFETYQGKYGRVSRYSRWDMYTHEVLVRHQPLPPPRASFQISGSL